jgi:hypothetical protein
MWFAAAALMLAACGGSSTGAGDIATDDAITTATVTVDTPMEDPLPVTTTTLETGVPVFAERMEAIDAAVAAWRTAPTLSAAQAAAETAANLVVGPNGPGYGDRDGDGVVGGASGEGVLPGLDGTTSGLAIPLSENACVEADVLGGRWDDPGGRWGEMMAAIDAWLPGNNTMPTLASHPMRVVGWSTFTLDTDSLDEAHEYAGHAKLHVDISVRALDC